RHLFVRLGRRRVHIAQGLCPHIVGVVLAGHVPLLPSCGSAAGGTSRGLLGAARGPPETRCSRSYLATRPNPPDRVDRAGSRRVTRGSRDTESLHIRLTQGTCPHPPGSGGRTGPRMRSVTTCPLRNRQITTHCRVRV